MRNDVCCHQAVVLADGSSMDSIGGAGYNTEGQCWQWKGITGQFYTLIELAFRSLRYFDELLNIFLTKIFFSA